jgi:uncharacterized Ntn-hydrolase superfamily protein
VLEKQTDKVMTFSLLVRDPVTGALGGAAATGSLCVGGWVLRGRLGAGLSASQGAAPSTFWGEEVLGLMQAGASAQTAVQTVTAPDPGRDWRQLACLDPQGGTAAHSGCRNNDARGHLCLQDRVASGNILKGLETLDLLIDSYDAATGPVSARLIAAMIAAQARSGDRRGLQSAALLVLQPDQPPLNLRVDWAEDPLAALSHLHARATSGDYAAWTRAVPVSTDRHRADAGILNADTATTP